MSLCPNICTSDNLLTSLTTLLLTTRFSVTNQLHNYIRNVTYSYVLFIVQRLNKYLTFRLTNNHYGIIHTIDYASIKKNQKDLLYINMEHGQQNIVLIGRGVRRGTREDREGKVLNSYATFGILKKTIYIYLIFEKEYY